MADNRFHIICITIHTLPDSHGKSRYSRRWITDYTPGHPGGEYIEREVGQECYGVLPAWVDVTKIGMKQFPKIA